MCHYWLLVNQSDSYRSMIVRFASWVTRGFLSPLLCLSLDILFAAKENLWDQGNLCPDWQAVCIAVLVVSTSYGNAVWGNWKVIFCWAKVLKLDILSTSFLDFLYDKLGELRSRSLRLKGFKIHLHQQSCLFLPPVGIPDSTLSQQIEPVA